MALQALDTLLVSQACDVVGQQEVEQGRMQHSDNRLLRGLGTDVWSRLLLNEQTVVERGERVAAHLAGVRYSRIQGATAGVEQLTRDEATRVIDAMHAAYWPAFTWARPR